MNPPLPVVPGMNSYLCRWADPAIEVEARNLTAERRHRLSGKVYVRADKNGSRNYDTGLPVLSPLAWGHIDLDSASGRETVWKKAARAAGDSTTLTGVNWEWVLDEGCRLIEEASSQPKSIYLQPSDDSKLPPYLLSPLLRAGQPTIVYGDGGAGKGILACFVATVLVSSWQNNPLEWMPPDEPCPVLYLDWEADEDTTAYRLACLQRGHDLQYMAVHYLRCDAQPLAAIADDVQRVVQAERIRAIIVDSLLPAAGTGYGDPAGPAKDLMGALRAFNCASFIVGHIRKPQPGEKPGAGGPYGSAFFRNLARQCWEFKSSKSFDAHTLTISLSDRKQNDAWGSSHPIGIRATFSEFVGDSARNISFEPCEISGENTPELSPDLGMGYHVLQALKTAGPSTVSRLSTLLSRPEDSIRPRLSSLFAAGQILRLGKEGQKTIWGVAAGPEITEEDT